MEETPKPWGEGPPGSQEVPRKPFKRFDLLTMFGTSLLKAQKNQRNSVPTNLNMAITCQEGCLFQAVSVTRGECMRQHVPPALRLKIKTKVT